MDSKFKSFIIALLRRGTQRWKPAQEALKEVKEVYYIKSKTGKDLRRVRFTCKHCGKQFNRKEVKIDHINPVVAVQDGFIDWETYITRMYPPKEGFQILCKSCDKVKTKGENEERKKYRTLRKNNIDK